MINIFPRNAMQIPELGRKEGRKDGSVGSEKVYKNVISISLQVYVRQVYGWRSYLMQNTYM